MHAQLLLDRIVNKIVPELLMRAKALLEQCFIGGVGRLIAEYRTRGAEDV